MNLTFGNVGIGFAHMLHFKPVPTKRSQENFKAVAKMVRDAAGRRIER
jgi:hypothetical protein